MTQLKIEPETKEKLLTSAKSLMQYDRIQVQQTKEGVLISYFYEGKKIASTITPGNFALGDVVTLTGIAGNLSFGLSVI